MDTRSNCRARLCQMKHMRVDLRRTVVCLTLVALAGIPLGGEIFYTRLFTRIMLYAHGGL